MILDAVPFAATRGTRGKVAEKAMCSFVEFFEKKFGVSINYDARVLPFGRIDLIEQMRFAQLLLGAGTIDSYAPVTVSPDDPQFKYWNAVYSRKPFLEAGGGAWENDAQALTAALAEALERAVWKTTVDYFKNPVVASLRDLTKKRLRFVPPGRFAAYSPEQRRKQQLSFSDETLFLWTQGESLTSGKVTYIPVQTVSGFDRDMSKYPASSKEPLIRARHTIGLATWPTQAGARLAGALECIERDAYMIMWFNQLTLPRLNLSKILSEHLSLSRLIETCERYRVKVHIIPLITDAPTYAIMAVIEDMSSHAPRFSVGLKAHRSLAFAIEKSTIEAMRGHRAGRRFVAKGAWDASMSVKDIGHFDRVHYWSLEQNERKLEFLTQGEIRNLPTQAWETDTIEHHLERVVEWCLSEGYECVSVPLTHSRKNPTSLHIEVVAIPELQQTHLLEKDIMLGGKRWREVPQRFGITPRAEIFTAEPHPFA